MTEKILVIGGSGLLGYHLKQNLIDFDTYFTYNENKLNSEKTNFLDSSPYRLSNSPIQS